MEKSVCRNCDECGQMYTTALSHYRNEVMQSECWTCRILSRIDNIMYHFGVE